MVNALPLRVKFLSLILVCQCGIHAFSYGQVLIHTVDVSPTLIGPKSLFRAAIHNAGDAAYVRIEGDLLDKSGTPVLSFLSAPRSIETGSHTISAEDLVMRSFVYASSTAGRIAQQFQRLPGGTYRFCLRVRTDTEGDDEWCGSLDVEDFVMLDLVHPWNKDTIPEVRPTLMWMMTSSTPYMNDAPVRLVVTSMPKGRTPAQSISAERPLFVLPSISDRSVPFPAGVADLVPGQCYAWQVERSDGNRVLERSEPWGFCVALEPLPIVQKYIDIDGERTNAIHEPIDRRLFFRINEQYASTLIRCRIISDSRKITRPVPLRVQGDEVVQELKQIDLNHYELDLSGLALEPGYYQISVLDEKDREHVVKIRIQE